MPSKGHKAASGSQKPLEQERQEPLLAIVLADSFESRFKPFTLYKPRCLLPLANTPIIQYTLDFLASNGVEQVLIYAANHVEQVEQYIETSEWRRASSPFQSISVLKTAASSVGDCLRDLDGRDIAKGDFLIVAGDVVSNFNLGPAFAKHRARRQKDKNAIMTMILRDDGLGKRLSSRQRNPVFVIDPTADRCLHYETVGGRGSSKYITLDPEFLTGHTELDIYEDLVDPHIDICTPEVLALWNDNFDYQSLRESFLFGVLKDWELNGKTIHTHLMSTEYAARVTSMRSYHHITDEVLRRRAFPFTPEVNGFAGQFYHPKHPNVFKGIDVEISRSAQLTGSCIIGQRSTLEDKSILSNTVIGAGCRIGRDVVITDAQLWDNVVVEDNASITGPVIIGDNVLVKANAIISSGVAVSPRVTVDGADRISNVRILKHDNGSQRESTFSEDSDASSNASLGLAHLDQSALSSRSSISSLAASDDFEPRSETSRRSSFVSDPSDEGTTGNKDFFVEATASILDGITKGDDSDTIFLELNGYRMSVNASPHQVRHAVVAACVKRIIQLSEKGSAREAAETVFESYKTLFERVIQDNADAEKTDQVDLLLLVQRELLPQINGDQLLLFLANQLYHSEIVEEDGVLQWWEDPKSQAGDMEDIRGLTIKLIDYLKEAEEESDEEDEDDDDD